MVVSCIDSFSLWVVLSQLQYCDRTQWNINHVIQDVDMTRTSGKYNEYVGILLSGRPGREIVMTRQNPVDQSANIHDLKSYSLSNIAAGG